MSLDYDYAKIRVTPTPAVPPVQPVASEPLGMAQADSQFAGHEHPAQSSAASAAKQPTTKPPLSLNTEINKINAELLGRDVKLKYRLHQRTGRTYVQLVDMQTDKVLKEIPSAKMLDIIGKIWDQMGIAVDRKG